MTRGGMKKPPVLRGPGERIKKACVTRVRARFDLGVGRMLTSACPTLPKRGAEADRPGSSLERR